MEIVAVWIGLLIESLIVPNRIPCCAISIMGMMFKHIKTIYDLIEERPFTLEESNNIF